MDICIGGRCLLNVEQAVQEPKLETRKSIRHDWTEYLGRNASQDLSRQFRKKACALSRKRDGESHISAYCQGSIIVPLTS